jgi:hypothetical protein
MSGPVQLVNEEPALVDMCETLLAMLEPLKDRLDPDDYQELFFIKTKCHFKKMALSLQRIENESRGQPSSESSVLQ